MRRSSSLQLTLLLAVATACKQSRHCVDENDRVVDDSLCVDEAAHRPTGLPALYYLPHYVWWYGGRAARGGVIYGGSPLSGSWSRGSATPSTSPSPAVSRGGFGSSASAHGAAGE
jgi:hypothetical protein